MRYRHPRPSLFKTFFDDAFTKDMFMNEFETRSPGTKTPSANITELEDSFLIELAMPGINKDNINIELNEDVLTISGEVNKETKQEDGQYRRREFFHRSYKRSFRLPDVIDSDGINAKSEDGVLKVTLPKSKEAKIEKTKQFKVG